MIRDCNQRKSGFFCIDNVFKQGAVCMMTSESMNVQIRAILHIVILLIILATQLNQMLPYIKTGSD